MTAFSPVRLVLLALVLAVGAVPVRANIGDNLDQLRKRYGSAKDMGSQMLFQHNGFSICVYFDGDRSAMEVFVRDGSDHGQQEMTQKDIDAILAAASDGKPWNEMQDARGRTVWLTPDRQLLARLSVGKGEGEQFLTIMHNERTGSDAPPGK